MEDLRHQVASLPLGVGDATDQSADKSAAGMPLVVDLDGTLIRTDLLVETSFSWMTTSPLGFFHLCAALLQGKAILKDTVAAQVPIDPRLLPYNERVLALIEAAKAENRPVYLASSSNERYVSDICKHLKLFDGYFASTRTVNLSARTKADKLVQAFGEKGFDYVGNSTDDVPVWKCARHSYAVAPSSSFTRRIGRSGIDIRVIPSEIGPLRAFLKLLRIHQWVKNLLVFVPIFAAHAFSLEAVMNAGIAFVAFCLAASGVYVLNDLVDIAADRRHPSKKRRPLAAGTFPILLAAPTAAGLIVSAICVAAAVSTGLALALLSYIALTTAYSFWLKRKMLIDVIALTALYCMRVISGAVAIMVPASEWLIMFSMFLFGSLAMIKRYIELATLADATLPDPENRNYRKTDMDIVACLAAACGLNAVTVFALYVSSTAVQSLYRTPKILWLVCPILMYWLARLLLMAHRRLVHDDPIVFALRDRNSHLAAIMIGLIFLAATSLKLQL